MAMSTYSIRKNMILLLAYSLIARNAAGKLFVTAPVEGTTWTAGQNQTISWKDDSSSPSLTQFGKASVGIYVGSETVQTPVQQIVASVDVATTASIVFTPDPNAGASGDYYFIRFQSLNLKDANNTAYPAEAFSATFTINGMIGSFNASEKSEMGSMYMAPATASVTSSAGTLPATTTPSRFTTSSHAFNDAIPTAAGVTSANGSIHRIGTIPGWATSVFFVLLLAIWAH